MDGSIAWRRSLHCSAHYLDCRSGRRGLRVRLIQDCTATADYSSAPDVGRPVRRLRKVGFLVHSARRSVRLFTPVRLFHDDRERLVVDLFGEGTVPLPGCRGRPISVMRPGPIGWACVTLHVMTAVDRDATLDRLVRQRRELRAQYEAVLAKAQGIGNLLQSVGHALRSASAPNRGPLLRIEPDGVVKVAINSRGGESGC